MADDFGMELIDGRDALGIILFRDEGDQIATELKSIKIPKLELAKLCMQLGRALKAQHDAESEWHPWRPDCTPEPHTHEPSEPHADGSIDA